MATGFQAGTDGLPHQGLFCSKRRRIDSLRLDVRQGVAGPFDVVPPQEAARFEEAQVLRPRAGLGVQPRWIERAALGQEEIEGSSPPRRGGSTGISQSLPSGAGRGWIDGQASAADPVRVNAGVLQDALASHRPPTKERLGGAEPSAMGHQPVDLTSAQRSSVLQ